MMNKKLFFLSVCLFLAFCTSPSKAAENTEDNQTYIIGHWNYPPNSENTIYVISDAEKVELFINGISNGYGRNESNHLFTFDNVIFQPGSLKAVSYDKDGKQQSEYTLITSGVPAQLKLTVLDSDADSLSEDPDEVVIQCELTDFYGKRCFQDNRKVIFEIEEEGNLNKADVKPIVPRAYKKQLKLNRGENFITVKKPSDSKNIKVTAKTTGLAPSYIYLGSK